MQFHAGGKNQAVEPLELMQIGCFLCEKKKRGNLEKELYIAGQNCLKSTLKLIHFF